MLFKRISRQRVKLINVPKHACTVAPYEDQSYWDTRQHHQDREAKSPKHKQPNMVKQEANVIISIYEENQVRLCKESVQTC